MYNFFWKIDWNPWNFVNIPFKGVNPNKTITDSSKWISTVPDYKTSDQKMALFALFFKKSNQNNNETEREGWSLVKPGYTCNFELYLRKSYQSQESQTGMQGNA